MLIEERYRLIKNLLSALGQVSVERITAELGVSRETIRRDLLELEAQGELRRVHGGAASLESEPPIDVRAGTRVKEKRALAKAAATLIHPGQTLFLDAGTTTAIAAEALRTTPSLTIVTNSVAVANTFAAMKSERGIQHDVHFIGGTYDFAVGATYGSSAISEVSRFHADVALLSPVGVDAEHGATSFVREEAEMARAMARNARRTILLADFAKIGVRSRVTSCEPADVSLLITNQRAKASPIAAAIDGAFSAVQYV
jgi:DeoR/GlpR family transcriptional regulator of sugar metabolism